MMSTQENCENISEESKRTMIHLFGLAMKKDISWATLSSFIDDMASTLVKSKAVIVILLNEFENFINKSKNDQSEKNASDTEMLEKSLILPQSESQANIIEMHEKNEKELREVEPEIENITIDFVFDQTNKDSNFQSPVSVMETEDEVLEVIPENDYSKYVPITDDLKDQFFETLEDESQKKNQQQNVLKNYLIVNIFQTNQKKKFITLLDSRVNCARFPTRKKTILKDTLNQNIVQCLWHYWTN